MIYLRCMLPPHLQIGDTIGITAFAKKISLEEIQRAVSVFKSWGLNVVLGNTIGSSWNQFGGNDEMRRMDIQNMLDDPNIKAIISARGGYGSVRIIDDIDFSNFTENPKWLIGFSDITVFHSHIHQHYQVPTIHGTMPVFFPTNSEESLLSLKHILMNNEMDYEEQSLSPHLCVDGSTKAEIIGGNLSILYSLCGSDSAINTKGKILFLEDLCEYLYATDRMLQNLKRNGIFDDLAGVIIGGFSDMKDGPVPFGKTAEELVFDYVKHLNAPIFTGFPSGHINDNRSLVFGQPITMEVQSNIIKLKL